MLHDHLAMIDLGPQIEERHATTPPKDATPEEYHCKWYSLTDKIQYLPGGLYTGKVSYNVAFLNLPDGLSTHCYAPAGLNIRSRWQVGGSLPGELKQTAELGLDIPKEGLYLREDIDMKCSIFLTKFVKSNLRKAHGVLVARLVERAHIVETDDYNKRILAQTTGSSNTTTTHLNAPLPGDPLSPSLSSPGYPSSLQSPGYPPSQFQRQSLPPPGYGANYPQDPHNFAQGAAYPPQFSGHPGQIDPAYQQANPYAQAPNAYPQNPYGPQSYSQGGDDKKVYEIDSNYGQAPYNPQYSSDTKAGYPQPQIQQPQIQQPQNSQSQLPSQRPGASFAAELE